MEEIKKKDPRGRKPMKAGEKKVFIRIGVLAKHEAKATKLLELAAKPFK